MDEYLDLEGCRKLWCAVIGVAIQDVRSRDIMGALQAANWLREENSNLRNICEHLGLRTADIRDEALAGYKEPTYRQLQTLRAKRTPTTTKLLANNVRVQYDNHV